MIRVVIADDLLILRSGLKAILEQADGFEVLGLASNGREAYELAKEHSPDVVLMDMRMPEFDGEMGISLIKGEMPEIKVLVLTTFDDEQTISKAVSSGADGYILKEMESEKVIHAIKSVCEGVSVFEKTFMTALKSGFLRQVQ